jgi:hypothetical protein
VPSTARVIGERFRLAGVVDRYLEIYEKARAEGAASR